MARNYKLHDWPPDDELAELVRAEGQLVAADRLGVARATLQSHLRARGIQARKRSGKLNIATAPEDKLANAVHEHLKRKPKSERPTVHTLSDELDLPPSRVRDALDRLRGEGYRIPEEDEGTVALQKVAPARHNLHRSLLKGDEITVGIACDTHLSSTEHAGGALELAYDEFARRGITEVWHAGDLVAGRGIYRTQDQDLTRFTFDEQRDFAIEHYPKRDGITTRIISGNHDIEGEFGKIGANPVQAVANQRDDIEFLGDYSAFIELPNGAFAQLVHGRGGGSYALSYKPQKYVEGLSAGRKPALILFGHYHVSGVFRHRNVTCILGGCFEWQTSLLVRLGLQPDVGFYALTLRLGKDGSLVGVIPEWVPIYEGRSVK